jgi:hypothetical protein
VCSGDGTREERPRGARRIAGVKAGQLPRKRLRDAPGEEGRPAKRAKHREPAWHRGDTLVAIEKEVAYSGA